MLNPSEPPLIAHVMHRLDTGGLENGVVNLINRIPDDRYRHAVICMEDFTDFSKRIGREGVDIFAMHKKPGNDPRLYLALLRLFRRLKPDIVHTRNLAALDAVIPAALAGVPCRIHGEHGWDVWDIRGSNRKYQWLRRCHRPFIDSFIAVSGEIETYLRDRIHVPQNRIRLIHNGVDIERFHPPGDGRAALPHEDFARPGTVVIGAVGRLQAVKDHENLARAFVHLLKTDPALRNDLRLVIVGDGPLRARVESILEDSGARDLVWLAGSRDDVPSLLRCLDIFAQPSLSEGFSNTVLEAMASGLPVVATDVGETRQLVRHGCTGLLVPASDPRALAQALESYVRDERTRRDHGQAGHQRAVARFSLDRMVRDYLAAYDELLLRKGRARGGANRSAL